MASHGALLFYAPPSFLCHFSVPQGVGIDVSPISPTGFEPVTFGSGGQQAQRGHFEDSVRKSLLDIQLQHHRIAFRRATFSIFYRISYRYEWILYQILYQRWRSMRGVRWSRSSPQPSEKQTRAYNLPRCSADRGWQLGSTPPLHLAAKQNRPIRASEAGAEISPAAPSL